jgi:hypothetical protein
MEDRGLIKKIQKMAGVLIYPPFGKEKRDYLKNTVLKFNEAVKKKYSEEKLQHFIEVAEIINELISRKYFSSIRKNRNDSAFAAVK